MTKTMKKSMTKKIKGGNGILTYAVNDYKTDTQLDNNLTTRQMFNDQSTSNPRFLGGKKSQTKSKKNKNTKTSKKVKKMKKSKRGTRK